MNKIERQGIARLVEAFGAQVLINRPDYQPLTSFERAKQRIRASLTIEDCELCPLSSTCRQPVQPLWPSNDVTARAQILVLGEAPTEDDDKRGEPFSGRVGKIVRNGLVIAGIEPDNCAYGYVVSCRPHDEGISRAPSVYEQGRCSDNLKRVVDASDAEYILLFGAVATRAWREDVRLTDVAGQLFMWRQHFVYPMFSAQAVLRQTFNANTWREQLGRFAQIVTDKEGTAALSKLCAACSTAVDIYDADGVPWCNYHAGEHLHKRDSQDRKQNNRALNQGALFREEMGQQ